MIATIFDEFQYIYIYILYLLAAVNDVYILCYVFIITTQSLYCLMVHLLTSCVNVVICSDTIYTRLNACL